MNITKLLRRFEAAVRADEMKGSAAPSEVPEIEAELSAARSDLVRAYSADKDRLSRIQHPDTTGR